MLKRLFDRHHNTRNLREFLADVVENLFAATAALGPKADNDLGRIHTLRVFIELRSASAATERLNARNILESLIYHLCDPVRRFKRSARWQQYIYLGTSFVKRRQEVPAQPSDGG